MHDTPPLGKLPSIVIESHDDQLQDAGQDDAAYETKLTREFILAGKMVLGRTFPTIIKVSLREKEDKSLVICAAALTPQSERDIEGVFTEVCHSSQALATRNCNASFLGSDNTSSSTAFDCGSSGQPNLPRSTFDNILPFPKELLLNNPVCTRVRTLEFGDTSRPSHHGRLWLRHCL